MGQSFIDIFYIKCYFIVLIVLLNLFSMSDIRKNRPTDGDFEVEEGSNENMSGLEREFEKDDHIITFILDRLGLKDIAPQYFALADEEALTRISEIFIEKFETPQIEEAPTDTQPTYRKITADILQHVKLKDIPPQSIELTGEDALILIKLKKIFKKEFKRQQFEKISDPIQPIHRRIIVYMISDLLNRGKFGIEKVKLAKNLYDRFSKKISELSGIVEDSMFMYIKDGKYNEAVFIQKEFNLDISGDERLISRYKRTVESGIANAIWCNAEKIHPYCVPRDGKSGERITCGFECHIQSAKVIRRELERICNVDVGDQIKQVFRRAPSYQTRFALIAVWDNIGLRDVAIREVVYSMLEKDIDWSDFRVAKYHHNITFDEISKHPEFKSKVLYGIGRVINRRGVQKWPDGFIDAVRFFIDECGINIREIENYENKVRRAFKGLVESRQFQLAIDFEELFGEGLDLKNHPDYRFAQKGLNA